MNFLIWLISTNKSRFYFICKLVSCLSALSSSVFILEHMTIDVVERWSSRLGYQHHVYNYVVFNIYFWNTQLFLISYFKYF